MKEASLTYCVIFTANLISVLPSGKVYSALATFWSPIAGSLNQLSLAPPETHSVVLPPLLLLLDRLTIFVKHLDPTVGDQTHPLVPIMSESWVFFDR